MKYFLSIILTLFLFGSLDAQSFEDKVATRSCECLKKANASADSVIIGCISQSMLEIAIEDSTKKYIKIISTVEGVQKTTREARAKLDKNCEMIRPKEN